MQEVIERLTVCELGNEGWGRLFVVEVTQHYVDATQIKDTEERLVPWVKSLRTTGGHPVTRNPDGSYFVINGDGVYIHCLAIRALQSKESQR